MNETLTFADLGLSDAILKALEKKGYGYPTQVQAEAIPPMLQWKDVIAKAPTGTGKTFAFGIPMLEHMHFRAWFWPPLGNWPSRSVTSCARCSPSKPASGSPWSTAVPRSKARSGSCRKNHRSWLPRPVA